jgi:glycine betaine/proline transport system substrate-binding protein
MHRHHLMAATAMLMLTTFATTPAVAAEPESCRQVRLAEPGWNDLTFTTGVMQTILASLGYEPKSDLLGLDIIYQSLKNKDLDVFMGYWDPAMVTYYEAYKADSSVETVHQNLEGAKYTFAVPQYVADAGVKDIADLAQHADKFERKMYGIEPGSNQLMFDIIKDPAFKLDGWEVIESSEQGMLSQVDKAVRNKSWIVFQGWAPHPMNNDFPLAYLTGGDAYYGPDLGAATVHTQVRQGYLQECPNVATLLKNVTFDLPLENEGMAYLIRDSLSAADAAKKALTAHPEYLDGWLKGVTTFDGSDGLTAVKSTLGL